MITKLTPEQEAAMPAYVAEWVKHGLATGRTNHKAAEELIRRIYAEAGLEEPEVWWASNPLAMAWWAPVIECRRAGLIQPTNEQVRDATNAQVRAATAAQVGAAERVARENWTAAYCGVGWWCGWIAHRDYCERVLGIKMDPRFAAFRDLAKEVPCMWMGRRIVMLCERPQAIRRDAEGRLHSEDSPAVDFGAWKLWFLGGIRVDEQIVMRPETQTVAQIDKEDNADVRAIRIQRFGWPRYLRETNAKEIDSRENLIEGTLEALYETPDGARRLVATCPSGKVVDMGCPQEITTCEAAQRWIHPEPEELWPEFAGSKGNTLART